MVVAVKKEDKITVGVTICDSLIDMTDRDLSNIENIPFWKVKDCYIFAEDLTYSVDLLRYNDQIFKNITDGNSIILEVVPRIKELLDKHSFVINGKEWDSQLLIVKGNKMFTIGHYFTVSEIDDFVGLGFDSYLMGSLMETSDKPADESILFSVRNLNRMKGCNLFPVTLFNTETKKRKVYYK